MDEHTLTDLLLFFLAAALGGLIGGSAAYILGRLSRQTEPGAKARTRNLFLVPRRRARIYQFPKR